jgi:hydrogenase maturation protein HypF
VGAAERIRVRLSGAVQGVGMRPFVLRLALECGLSGFVHNGADGVTIEVEGAGIAAFLDRLSAEAPPLASIDALGIDTLAPSGEAGFSIRGSTGGRVATRIGPDAATCPACLEDLFNPASRFFRYPFVNCTHCGPRFTITRRLPYDRANTSMAGFAMCPDCATDYRDPANRRFHAEPIACPACGPRLSLLPDARASELPGGTAGWTEPPPGPPVSWPGLARPSTTVSQPAPQDVDGRDKPRRYQDKRAGGATASISPSWPGVSRPSSLQRWCVDGRDTPGHDDGAVAVGQNPSPRIAYPDSHGDKPGHDTNDERDPIPDIAAAIRAGRIVALKGIGGFHLICDARNETAVAALRQRKSREAKPFAVMVADARAIRTIADPTEAEATLAATSARPIVLMHLRPGAVAPSVSPGLSRLGVMLAYAPVHHLLFAELGDSFALVATSANPGGEPLVVDNADAECRLAGIADVIVTHDRPILIRADDSVAQVVGGAPALIRRARGYVPEPVGLAEDGPVVLALGAHLKSTVTVTRGREAFVSQHIGDLDTAETVRFWRETIDHLLGILGVRPELIACDLHPDYLSSRMAEEFGPPVVRVQHHAAHIAAVAAEHGLAGPVLGLALDGHGLGTDGGAWGGEMIVVDGAGWHRIGGLGTLVLPGGDRAAREPWRMGVAALHEVGRGATAANRFPGRSLAGPLAARLAAGAERVATSSLGRLFDAVAALLGVRSVQEYEGQAAMEMEALVEVPRAMQGGWTLDGGVLSFAPLLAAFADSPPDTRTGAELFHGTLIEGLAALAAKGAAASGLSTICAGGGCMMNRVLAEGLTVALSARGLTPFLARRLPPNDGGVSLGQAVMARRGFNEGG